MGFVQIASAMQYGHSACDKFCYNLHGCQALSVKLVIQLLVHTENCRLAKPFFNKETLNQVCLFMY